MKIGFNLLLYTGHVTEANYPVIEKLKKAGYDGVELPIFDVSNPAHFASIGKVLKDNGLECTAVTVLPDEAHNAISPVAANRQGAIDHLKRVLECAHNAGVQTLCGPYYQVLGQFTGAFPTEAELNHAAEVHRAIAPVAQAAGVKCAIEALNRFESHLLNTMEQAASYVKRVDHPNFGTMYDTFHANIEEKNLAQAIQAAASWTVLVHVSENDRSIPGTGHVQWDETFDALQAAGYDGWLVVEAFGLALPNIAAATKIWRRMFPAEEQLAAEALAFMKRHVARRRG